MRNLQNLLFVLTAASSGRCPSCGSDDVIPWGDGYQCRDCGTEYGRNPYR